MICDARMKAPTYPDADHSAPARPAMNATPAPVGLDVMDLIGPDSASAADFGPSWVTTSVIVLVTVAGSPTRPITDTIAISAGNNESRP